MKKENVSIIIKYLILFVLILTALVQVAKLWLDIPSYALLLENYTSDEQILERDRNYVNIILPATIGIRRDDGLYYTITNKVKGYEDFLLSCDGIIQKSIGNKETARTVEVDDFDFSLNYILIDYPFDLSKDVFFNMYHVDGYPDFPELIDYILIESTTGKSEKNRVFIHDAKLDEMREFSVDYNDVYIEVDVLNYTSLQGIYDKNIKYQLSREADYYFDSTFLLPRNNEYAILNNDINPYLPFYDGENFLLTDLNAFVKDFMGNKISPEPSVIKNSAVYIDDSAVIKYSNNGVFEYIEGIDKRGVRKNFLVDFAAGIDFVDKKVDKGLVEYYLNSYEYLDDGLHIYYDLGYNGIKFDFSEKCKENDMLYPMEIVVYNGKMVYFKWLLRFMPDMIQQPERIMLSYDEGLKRIEASGKKCDKVELIYSSDDEDLPRLMWKFISGDEELKEVVSE